MILISFIYFIRFFSNPEGQNKGHKTYYIMPQKGILVMLKILDT